MHCCHPQYVAQVRDGWQSKAGSGKRGDLGGPQHLVDICQTLRINKHFRVCSSYSNRSMRGQVAEKSQDSIGAVPRDQAQ